MTGFVLGRVLRAVLTLLVVLSLTFVMLRMTGDPTRMLLPDTASDEMVASFRAHWGLDQPILMQYLHYTGNLLKGDAGLSIANGRPALLVATERLPATLKLTTTALVLMLLIGVPAGILAALKRGSIWDRSVMLLATLGFSLPGFVVSIGLVYLFAVWLRWLPSSGSASLRHMVLPVLTLGLAGAAGLARYIRVAVLDVMERPFILAARASGKGRAAILWQHVLPNAAISLVTILGFMVAGLFGGSIIIEQVFGWPGIGRLLLETVGMRDFAVVQMLVILFTAIVTLCNLTVDIAYGILNPRIQATAC
ncbi:ABC transporter permease [Xinfangfangia sp. D13-10-4-6]|uniref:ABC transporter permease n=1 Tax=Pseudogemmobacter hezensis TaxID=2737662 RepID=UPI001557953F|nr:ABC transporter permease [Pseudogemmobacter hezensis]NPD17457.1 ABC transporter permease [Pseudogemmobacter hezensis]